MEPKNTSWSYVSQNVIVVLWFSTVCSHIAAKCIDSIAKKLRSTSYIVGSSAVVYQVYYRCILSIQSGY